MPPYSVASVEKLVGLRHYFTSEWHGVCGRQWITFPNNEAVKRNSHCASNSLFPNCPQSLAEFDLFFPLLSETFCSQTNRYINT
jgi:hypothetical protein